MSSTEFTRMAPIQAFAPAGAAYLMLRTGIASTTPRSIGDTIDVRKFIVEAGTYNGGDYFDGDSPDTVSTDYAWTGTPGLSTSTQTTRVASGSYTADLSAGILYAGSPLATRCWLPGVDQVVVTYVAGRVADTASVPANVKMAARLILAHNYQADQQGFRPDLGSADGATQMTPSGYAIPRRAYAYLEPMSTTAVPSFA